MDIEPGDTILKINGRDLCSEKQLSEFLASCPVFIWMEVEKAGGKVVTVEYSDYRKGIGDLGVLIVPHDAEFYYEIGRGRSLIKKMIKGFQKKHDKDIGI